MPYFTTKTIVAAVAGAVSVAAHGHVRNIVINGASYQGFDINSFPYMSNPPKVAGWTASNTDNGFVGPEAFASEDIICHRGSRNAGAHAVVAAGDRIFLQWDTWPESHHGPVIDYLANCGSASCESVDKTSLEFFKIDEVGLVDGRSAPGFWGSDQLIANNNSWLVEIPSNIAPGFYVLRHEIIALHAAGQTNGAQNYPQCFNLQITGSGTATPSGVRGTSLYKPNDAGILFDIYRSMDSYPIPGPAPIQGAASIVQGSSSITASATAITGSATGAPAAPTTTAIQAPSTSVTSTAVQATPTTIRTSIVASTTARPTATSPAPAPIVIVTTIYGCPDYLDRHNGKPRRHARDIAVDMK